MKNYQNNFNYPEKVHRSHLKGIPAKNKIYIPRMCDHSYGIAAALEFCGIDAEVLPKANRETIELGRKYVSGKQCYPCVITISEMLKKSFSLDFNPDNSLFFMPSGTGPCRFGQYSIFQKLMLDRCGLNNVQVFSPIQDVSFYSDLGIAGKDFIRKSWQGIIAIEMLTKCLHETRPYERENGLTDFTYNKYLYEIVKALKAKNGSLESTLKRMCHDFSSIPKYDLKKPRIGVIGEIFVRSNSFANENLIAKIESLGGEVWLSPPEEWIYYVNYISFRHSMIKRDISAIVKLFLKNFFQKRIEHNYGKLFRTYLKTLDEPTTAEIIKKASPYVHSTFEGETILSIGKSIDLIERGVSGLINAMPFGCMPGTIVTALLKAISRDYGVPCISIPYDGTESPSIALQLEAFMEQANAFKKEITKLPLLNLS